MMTLLLATPFLFGGQPHYWSYVDRITAKENAYLKKKYKLSLSATGGGGMVCVDNVSQGYAAPYPATIAEARALIVEIADDLLREINAHSQLRNHLSEYPFTAKGLHLTLHFRKHNAQTPPEKQITLVFLINQKIYYHYPMDVYASPYGTALVETFEEAKILLRN